MHVDIQQTIALGIVFLAALSVGRRLWSHIAGFRGKAGSRDTGGCDGCPSSGNAVPAPLIQIGTRPPRHLRRPPADGS